MRIPLAVARTALIRSARPVLGPPVPIAAQRALVEGLSRALPAALPAGTTVTPSTLGGRPADVVTTPGATGAPVLLLHGGAFITCSPRTHRGFAAALSAAAGAPVHVQDYRLAPEHPFPAPVDDACAALDELGPGTRLVGDSAGGCLALLAVQRLRDAGRPLPVKLGLASPLADTTLASSRGWNGPDPLLRQSWIEQGTRAFAGPSPLDADLSGLPPLLVHVSSDERLRPEGEELVRRVRAAGGTADLHLLQGAWHDIHLQAGLVQLADDAVAHLGRWLR